MPRVLRGNENMKFGYPGGHGRLLVKHYYVIMHNDNLRIPEWVTYHLTREDMQGQA
jgi:DNA/RNA endonuclease G (NUC1)